eukprot:1146704-Rhodomonas_salina.1
MDPGGESESERERARVRKGRGRKRGRHRERENKMERKGTQNKGEELTSRVLTSALDRVRRSGRSGQGLWSRTSACARGEGAGTRSRTRTCNRGMRLCGALPRCRTRARGSCGVSRGGGRRARRPCSSERASMCAVRASRHEGTARVHALQKPAADHHPPIMMPCKWCAFRGWLCRVGRGFRVTESLRYLEAHC